MSKTVTVLKFDENRDEFPLHIHCSDQEFPHPAYVGLDCMNRTLYAAGDECDEYDEHEEYRYFSNFVSTYVRYYPCRNTLTTKEINSLLDELTPLATRVVNGYRAVWNGNLNCNIAVLNTDAQLAECEIRCRCLETFEDDPPFMEDWDTCEWISSMTH